jgi:hypothetical protein
VHVINHLWLMRESERRVEEAAYSRDVDQQQLAQRVLSNPDLQRLWESEHSGYMHRVADHRRHRPQLAALRRVAFTLIHRKALFEYLRDAGVRGEERRRVVALFHGSRVYTEAVIAEHQLYVRSSLSHLCAAHIGATLEDGPAFEEPMQRYQQAYLEYLSLYCQAHAAQRGRADTPEFSLLPYLKREVDTQRAAILALGNGPAPRSEPFAVVHIGDTVRLRRAL